MRKIVRQERLKDDKKARLIEAAIEEFNEHGLQNASYNRIIERSGLLPKIGRASCRERV